MKSQRSLFHRSCFDMSVVRSPRIMLGWLPLFILTTTICCSLRPVPCHRFNVGVVNCCPIAPSIGDKRTGGAVRRQCLKLTLELDSALASGRQVTHCLLSFLGVVE